MERVSLIKEGFKGIGTEEGVYYTNQEIVDRLKNLQSALAQGVFEKTHAENFSEREVIRHFETLISDYGMEGSERFLRFKSNMNNLGYTIASYIKGFAGERNARKALKLISMDKSVTILYNVCLEDEDCNAEYDALVITPYGLFVIEVKNWFGTAKITSNGLLENGNGCKILYDLAGRMNVKEALLKECLGDLFPKQYVNMLLFPNEKMNVIDEYHRLPYFIGGSISSDIRLYAKCGNNLTDKQISKIAERILACHKEQKTLCDVKCEEIIDDYAHLMAEIESRALDAKLDNEKVRTQSKPKNAANRPERKCFNWKAGAKYGAIALFGIGCVTTVYKKIKGGKIAC